MVKISIIVPAYNCSTTIRKCLGTALGQSVEDIEVLVCDDLSTDSTPEILKEISEQDPRVRFFRNAKNFGPGVTRRKLLHEAKGSYYAFLDTDDYWEQDKIRKQLDFMQKYSLDVCFSRYRLIDENGALLGSRNAPNNITYFKMLITNWIPTSSAMLRADLIGSRDMPEMRKRQDYGYWINLFRQNPSLKCMQINETLFTYTRRKDSLSSSKLQNLKANYRMYRDVCKFGISLSTILVCLNIAIRMVRT